MQDLRHICTQVLFIVYLIFKCTMWCFVLLAFWGLNLAAPPPHPTLAGTSPPPHQATSPRHGLGTPPGLWHAHQAAPLTGAPFSLLSGPSRLPVPPALPQTHASQVGSCLNCLGKEEKGRKGDGRGKGKERSQIILLSVVYVFPIIGFLCEEMPVSVRILSRSRTNRI